MFFGQYIVGCLDITASNIIFIGSTRALDVSTKSNAFFGIHGCMRTILSSEGYFPIQRFWFLVRTVT